VLKVFVRTAKEIADQDAAPTKLLQLWTKTGNVFERQGRMARRHVQASLESARRPGRRRALHVADRAGQAVRAGAAEFGFGLGPQLPFASHQNSATSRCGRYAVQTEGALQALPRLAAGSH
jgi:hypothetical protein